MATLGTAPAARVRETTTDTGTGNFVLDGAKNNKDQTFLGTYGGGASNVPYLIANQDAAEWEEGLATVQDNGQGSTEIVRGGSQTVTASSNGGSAVNFGSGTKDVFSPLSAEQAQAIFDHVNSTANPHSVTKSQVSLGNVPNEDATDMYNWDQRGASGGQVPLWDSGNSRWQPGDITSGDDLSDLPTNTIGQTASNITLDLSQYNVFEFEPTADITVDITGLASGGRAVGYINGTNLGTAGITWQVNGSGANVIFDNFPTLVSGYDIGQASFSQSFDVSGQDGTPNGISWNNDGSKMYVVGADNTDIYEYDVSTAYDISTASFSQSFDVSGQDTSPRGLAWNDTGSKMYMIGGSNGSVYEYDLTTKFDISTASFSQSFSVGGQDSNMQGISWNNDGSKFYGVGRTNDNIYEYDVSTAYDISTASFSQSFDISTEESTVEGMAWNGDGSKVYIVGRNSDQVHEYNLSTPFDISTASFSQQLDVASEDGEPRGIAFNDTGSKLYMAGANNDNVYEYEIPANQVLQIVQFDGSRAVLTG